ncbi:hypothetical protein ASPWEDRAFT_127770 [Aspergillus wentii DTO 134E9]|uniref:Mediator of RNA polymerase II transcription subunit 16 n=1 Tax=Aspergillus wentii DTO 134E9 TaxID=1073089 RepID=A0A1L9RVL9_ASPWE|nr:uncharacterized protein ASPWEDRAFT_127770 [Aspergillus wentii DTO 134E9]KAI9928807.1 mediator complex subunit [Aspergillus wentii]OJJ38907.1 hypothetical protein ASPWEDRAFT_127770 [Aspergillus wentii DTO 134E9]
MPLMMEDSINVDDLFGEPTSLELGLSSSSSTLKGLVQRLDEMRLVGCCQKIAWSRLGCIAYISQDSLKVKTRHLQCQPSDGKWVLSDDTPLLPVTDAHGGYPLVHLSWNETGTELAVVDSSGRVSVYSISIALNSIAGQRQANFDPSDDAAQIVGMMWLNTQRFVHAFNQATKVNGRWGYSPVGRRPIGPFHPSNKAVLLCVTRSGQIRLIYQNPDGKWAEINTELKNTGYSDRLLTHAALVASPAGVFIATHSSCQKICLYRLQVTWNPPNWDPKIPASAQSPPVPSMRFAHCKVETPGNILSTAHSSGENSDQTSSSTNSVYSLTRLEIICAPAVDSQSGSTPPWILAVFSNSLHATNGHPEQQGPASVIVRWQLESGSQTLHPKFDEVPSKKNNAQVKPKMELRRLENIYSDKHIISIDQTEYGNVLAVTYDDSSVIFYDPKTMAVFSGMDDVNTVTSLAQAGFHYPSEISGIHTSFSPNATATVMLDSEGQMQLRPMGHWYGAEHGLFDESKFSAAIAGLTLAFCRGSGSDVNTDDILLIVQQQLPADARVTFINEVYRGLPINCDFTAEQDKLMNHPYIPRCLSLQAAIGFRDKYKPRNPPSAVSWAILNLRHASVLFAYFFTYNKTPHTTNKNAHMAEPHDPDVLRMVLGNTKWALDFSQYIMNEIFDLADEFEGVLNDQEALSQKLKTTNSLPLIILLSSMSRAFLRFICRGLRGVYGGYASSPGLTGDARIHYAEICQTMDASPVRIDVHEKFLSGVDSAVRHAYQGAGFGDAERPGPEKELLVNARIPPVLVTAVATLLRQTIPIIKPDIDRMAIYLGDYSWLGFGHDRRTEFYRRNRDVDIVKKTPLRVLLPASNPEQTHEHGSKPGNNHGQQRRRRCVRCCELSGDAHTPRSMLSLRMIAKLGLLRSCLCGGMWTLESGSGLAPSQPPSTPMMHHQSSGRTPALVEGLAGSS